MWPGQYCLSWSSRESKKRVGILGDCPPSSNPRVYPTLGNITIFRIIITRPLSTVGDVAVCLPATPTPAICRRAAAQGYEDFYFPLVEENRLRCVTNCTTGIPGAMDCNQGQCLLERSGPTCR